MAWGAGDKRLEKILESKPAPKGPKLTHGYERRSRPQRREFIGPGGAGRPRSASISRENQRRLVTFNHTEGTMNHGPWQQLSDTGRSHRHDGGGWHTPTAGGPVPGTTSTPTQRGTLDGLPSTTSATTPTGPWDY